MAFPTTSIIDSGSGADDTTPDGWTFDIYGTSGVGIQRLNNEFVMNNAGVYETAYRTSETVTDDCEVYATISTLGTDSVCSIAVLGRINQVGSTNVDLYQAMYRHGTDYGTGGVVALGKKVNSGFDWLGTDYTIATPTAGDGIGLQCIGDQISAWHRRNGTWTQVILVTDTSVTTGSKIGIEIELDGATNFGGGSYVSVSLDTSLPDADVTTTGWTTTPLYSKVNDSSDATVIQATAS